MDFERIRLLLGKLRCGPAAPPLLVLAFAACTPEPVPVIVMGPAAPSSAAPVAVATRPPRPAHALGSSAAKPSGPPLDVLVRDRRPDMLSPRPRQLLVTEIQGLETIRASSPAAAMHQPNILQRLAEMYAQLAISAAPEAPHIVQPARQKAMQYYGTLAQQYRTWCADPSKGTGCADEALYYLGLEAERDGDIIKAQRAYFSLLQQWPASRLVSAVHLAFGEMYLANSAVDPALLPSAEQSYLWALKVPPPDNTVYGYAQLQLGQVYLRRDDPLHGIGALDKAIAWSSAYPHAPGAAEVAEAARAMREAAGTP